ncbi:hypothetical protein QQG55_47715 [Brugia pahangi]
MPTPNSIQLLILFGQQLKRREKEVHSLSADSNNISVVITTYRPFRIEGKNGPSFLEINHAESAITGW